MLPTKRLIFSKKLLHYNYYTLLTPHYIKLRVLSESNNYHIKRFNSTHILLEVAKGT